MANTIKLKRSAIAGKVPTTSDLAQLGEIGLNVYDGAIYMRRDQGTPEIVCVATANQDYGLITGSVNGTLDYGALS